MPAPARVLLLEQLEQVLAVLCAVSLRDAGEVALRPRREHADEGGVTARLEACHIRKQADGGGVTAGVRGSSVRTCCIRNTLLPLLLPQFFQLDLFLLPLHQQQLRLLHFRLS